jgi:hypothetical protein
MESLHGTHHGSIIYSFARNFEKSSLDGIGQNSSLRIARTDLRWETSIVGLGMSADLGWSVEERVVAFVGT